MNTEQLIQAMAADTQRTRPLEAVLPAALVATALLFGGIFLLLMGVRPDLGAALRHFVVVLKTLLPLALAVGALGTVLHLSRPGDRPGPWRYLLVCVPAAILLAMLAAGTGLAPAAIGAEVFKAGIASCVTVIPLISLPVAAASLWLLRRGASIRPRLTGAMAGLMSAGAGATMYSFYCTDDNPLFYGTWYTVAILVVTLACAHAGGRLLRW